MQSIKGFAVQMGAQEDAEAPVVAALDWRSCVLISMCLDQWLVVPWSDDCIYDNYGIHLIKIWSA